jgi:hypothetical protein
MMLKTMILPRQARDRHWESTHEKTVDAGTLSRSELIRSLRRWEKRAFLAIYIKKLIILSRQARDGREHTLKTKDRFFTQEQGPGHRAGPAGQDRRRGTKTVFFECFPYVCPEPVLAE